MDITTLHDGRILHVHEKGDCVGEHCCIHNPSDHPLNTAPLDWWGESKCMVRVCKHGFRHPDPDDMTFHLMLGDFLMVEAMSSVHLMSEHCDGCCHREEDVNA